MSKECSNFQCKDSNGVRTILPSDANYCFVCGRAVSEKAIERQAKKINNIRSRKLNDANNEILLLKTKLSEMAKLNSKLDAEVKNANLEKSSLQIAVDEVVKDRINVEPIQNSSVPKFVYVFFCFLGIVFLIFLWYFRND